MKPHEGGPMGMERHRRPCAGYRATHFRYEASADGRVATITLDRPERKNPLSFDSYAELRDLFRELVYASDVRAVVVTGAGGNFCSGGDVHEIIGPLTRMQAPGLLAFTRMTGDLVKAMRHCPQPIIAAIDGICAGAGAIMAMASDLRIGTARAKTAFLFVRVGLAGADMGACAILPRIIGQGRASELLYTGRSMGGEIGQCSQRSPAQAAVCGWRTNPRAFGGGPVSCGRQRELRAFPDRLGGHTGVSRPRPARWDLVQLGLATQVPPVDAPQHQQEQWVVCHLVGHSHQQRSQVSAAIPPTAALRRQVGSARHRVGPQGHHGVPQPGMDAAGGQRPLDRQVVGQRAAGACPSCGPPLANRHDGAMRGCRVDGHHPARFHGETKRRSGVRLRFTETRPRHGERPG